MTTGYVADASALIESVVGGKYAANAREFIGIIEQGHEVWIPEFCLLECANVLWKRVRFNDIKKDEAQTLLIDLYEMPLSNASVKSLLMRALNIGLGHGLAVYDTLYIALAEALKLELVTLDDKQARVAEALGIRLKPITDFTPQTS